MKKNLTKALALIAGCAVMLFGTTAMAEEGYKDTIVIGENTEPKNLDPDQSWGAAEARFSCFIHEGLVREDSEGKIIPLLAESWDISDDGLVYTFKLKEGVKFSDGTDVTGEDWIWSLERARDAETSNSRSVAANIASVEAPDETTLVITLSQPEAAFLANCCKWNMVVKSKAHFEEVGEEGFLRDPLGTGPYKVVEWKQGEYIQCEANEYYHVEGQPYTKNLTYKIITDDNTRVLQLKSGDVDIIGMVPVNMMPEIEADANLTAKAFTGSQIRFLVMNCADEVLADQNVRDALYYAMDKEAIVNFVSPGYAVPAASYISSINGDLFNSDLTDARDVDKAKELLAEAGYADGLDLRISITGGNTVYENIATVLQALWAEAGINLTIEPLESATLIDSLEASTYQLTLLQWTDSTPDPNDISAYECNYADSYQWYSGVQDQAIEDLYFQTTTAVDPAERADLFWQLQEAVYARKNIIPLFQAQWAYGYNNKVEGINVTPFNKINVAEIRVAE